MIVSSYVNCTCIYSVYYLDKFCRKCNLTIWSYFIGDSIKEISMTSSSSLDSSVPQLPLLRYITSSSTHSRTKLARLINYYLTIISFFVFSYFSFPPFPLSHHPRMYVGINTEKNGGPYNERF